MRGRLDFRKDQAFGCWSLCSCVLICPPPYQKSEIKSCFGRPDFFWRDIVVHSVSLFVCEPQNPVLLIQIHAARITNAARENFAARAVKVHFDAAANSPLGELRRLLVRRHIKRLPQGYVELVVGPHAADSCTMIATLVLLRNELALGRNDFGSNFWV